MTKQEFIEELDRRRLLARDLGEGLGEIPEPDSPWYPLKDDAFWATLERIQSVGETEDESGAAFLIGLILIDNLGPMMRALLLAKPALLAVPFISEAVQREIVENAMNLDYLTAQNKKKGMLKLIEASGFRLAPEPLLRLLSDPDDLIRGRAEVLFEKIAAT